MKLNKYDYNRLLRVLVGLFSRNKIFRNVNINEAIDILKDKGFIPTDKKLKFTNFNKWILVD